MDPNCPNISITLKRKLGVHDYGREKWGAVNRESQFLFFYSALDR